MTGEKDSGESESVRISGSNRQDRSRPMALDERDAAPIQAGETPHPLVRDAIASRMMDDSNGRMLSEARHQAFQQFVLEIAGALLHIRGRLAPFFAWDQERAS